VIWTRESDIDIVLWYLVSSPYDICIAKSGARVGKASQTGDVCSWTGRGCVHWSISSTVTITPRMLANSVGFHGDRDGRSMQLVVQTATKNNDKIREINTCQEITMHTLQTVFPS